MIITNVSRHCSQSENLTFLNYEESFNHVKRSTMILSLNLNHEIKLLYNFAYKLQTRLKNNYE